MLQQLFNATSYVAARLAQSRFGRQFKLNTENGRKGMELVQVAILIGIAVAVGLIFRKQITGFVKDIFGELESADF